MDRTASLDTAVQHHPGDPAHFADTREARRKDFAEMRAIATELR